MEATFANICETDPVGPEIQTESYLAGFAGREITDWDGVYEVREFNGQYDLLVAMDSAGRLGPLNVEISGIPAPMALALQKEQPIRFSGNIAPVDRLFGTNCNPIVVQDATFPGVDTARAAAVAAPAAVTDPATVEGNIQQHLRNRSGLDGRSRRSSTWKRVCRRRNHELDGLGVRGQRVQRAI